MGEVFTYDATTLTTIRDGTVEFTQTAEKGYVGSGRFAIDDTAGTIAIVGQKDFSATQSSCSVPLLFRGYIGERTYGRDAGEERAPHVAASRGIDVALQDLNAMLGFRALRKKTGMSSAEAGKRPAETVAARVAWLLASDALSGLVIDNGRITSVTDKGMDAADYRNQFPGDVLADCALAAGGFNYYVADFGSGPELVFRNDNTSTADTSTLRISNVLADASGVTLPPFMDFALRRDPSRVISHLGHGYAMGTMNVERDDTATAFNGERSGQASNSNVKTAAKASNEGHEMLWQRSTEEDVLEGPVLVTAAQVNLILAGQRILAKFSHLTTEGYGADFTYFRVLERTVRSIVADAGLYELRLKLSPQEPAEVIAESAIVQSAFGRTAGGGGTGTLPNPVTIGNLLVYVVSDRGIPEPVAPSVAPGVRWGAGAWTKLPNAMVNGGRGADDNGVAIWYKTADAVDNVGTIGSTNANWGIWEIAGATVTGATAIYVTAQADAAGMDIGTLGVAATNQIAVMIHGWDEQATADPFGSPSHPTLPLVTPDAGWTTRLYDSAVEGWPLLEQSPITVICDAVGTGATLNPKITKSALSNWGDAQWWGAALLLEIA